MRVGLLRTIIVCNDLSDTDYVTQEAKESLASPDYLFDGKLNVVKIVDEN